MKHTEKNDPVQIRIAQEGIVKEHHLHAYVVSDSGSIIETAAFDEKNQTATLKTPRRMLDKSKVYVAKELPKGQNRSKMTERNLVKGSAYQVLQQYTGNTIQIARIPSGTLMPYPYYNCLITGHVNKNFFIDGRWQNLPLCDMRVHICEVETELRWPYIPIYYRRIPDWVIQEIAQKIVALPNKPIPPDPIGPVSDPLGPVINPLAEVSMEMTIQARMSQTKSIQSRKQVQTKRSLPAELPSHVMLALQSNSVSTIRQAMIDYHDLIYPYICLWPYYWPWIYTYDEETIVQTDCNGHFQMWENTWSEDGPLNIYIWVEAFIDGSWVTVYKPNVPCNTWWNYACGTDINITITDPRVGPCHCGADGPADAVWFRSIGWSASALHIEQSDVSAVNLQGVSVPNVGCTNILGEQVRPFASGLTFKLFCGADIFNSGATHYRWKQTRIADANLNPIPLGFQTTSIIQGTVVRPYLVKLSATHYETHTVTLGAVGSGGDVAYHIPHQNIMDETLITAPDSGLDPTWTDIFFDSAYIDTHSLSDGLYRFDLELLKLQAGSFHVVAVPKATFQVSEYNAIGNSQDAPNAYLTPDANPANALSLSFKVRIDNANCAGSIHDAFITANGSTEYSGTCGFLHYTDTNQPVHISFEASHPRNFAKFSFNITKGNGTEDTGIHPGGYVISSVAGFTLAAGTFGADFTVAQLAGACPQAAFAEDLHVLCLATDGTYDLGASSGSYRVDRVGAFALSNT